MNKISDHINIILVCCNIIGLTTYCHLQYLAAERQRSIPYILPFCMAFVPFYSHPYVTRSVFLAIALLSFVAVFQEHSLEQTQKFGNMVSILLAGCSLGLSINLGYHIVNQIYYLVDEQTVRKYEGAINLSISVGMLLGTLGSYFNISILSVKILVIMMTTTNIYIPVTVPVYRLKDQPIKNKAAFTLIPFYMQQWYYALGYAIGIYLTTYQVFSLSKHLKYIIVSGLVLIEMLTFKFQIKFLSQFARSALVYHFQTHSHRLQTIFIIVFIVLRLDFREDVINGYIALGYAFLCFWIWRGKDKNTSDRIPVKQGQSLESLSVGQSSEIEMSLLNNSERYSVSHSYLDQEPQRRFSQ